MLALRVAEKEWREQRDESSDEAEMREAGDNEDR